MKNIYKSLSARCIARHRPYFLYVLLAFSFGSTAAPPHLAPSLAGLHVDMTFTAAVDAIALAGGSCDIATTTVAHHPHSGVCRLPICKRNESVCEPWMAVTAFNTDSAGQELRIGIEAKTAESPLQRIAFFYASDHEAVASAMMQRYGEPNQDGWRGASPGWSESLRMGWIMEPYRIGLVYKPNIILMTRELGTDGI